MVHARISGQHHGTDIVYFHSILIRHLHGGVKFHRRITVIQVNAKPPCLKRIHSIIHIKRSVSILLSLMAHPNLLVWNIIWDLALIHIHFSVISIPYRLILFKMFYHQRIHRDIIPVDDDSIFCLVFLPRNIVSVVCTPYPEVIPDHMVAVDRSAALYAYRCVCICSSDMEKQIA